MKKYLGLVLVFLLFALCSMPTLAKGEKSTEENEYQPEKMKCYYDVFLNQDVQKESVEKARKRVIKDFRETLKQLCGSRNVEYKIIATAGPDPINYKDKVSFIVMLYGKSGDIEEVDMELDLRYRDPPNDNDEFKKTGK